MPSHYSRELWLQGFGLGSSPNYSRFEELNNEMMVDERFELRIAFHYVDGNTTAYNWKQSTNPVTTNIVQDVETENEDWNGLQLNLLNDESFLYGLTNEGEKYYIAGTSQDWFVHEDIQMIDR
eukprot:UN16818